MKPQVLDKAIFLFRTNIYERYLKIASAVDSWNKIQEQLKSLSHNNIKTVVSNLYLKSYL